MLHTIYRSFHTSFIMLNIKKQGIKLNKMINPRVKQSLYRFRKTDHLMPSVKSLTKTDKEPGKRSLKRTAMLNKVIMKYITDILSTGTVSLDILGRGIEVSKVKIAPDFKTVNVYWVCKGTSEDAETEAILNKTAKALRHELSILRVMGEVPYIVFVKDLSETMFIELDKKLATADYGTDFEPTDLGVKFKSEFALPMQLSPEIKDKIKAIEDSTETIDDPIPEMTHNIYGLDHSRIWNRIMAARKKRSEAWSSLDQDVSTVVTYRSSDVRASSVCHKTQKKDLAEFILKRKILNEKIHKQMQDSSNLNVNPKEDNDDDDDFYDDDDEFIDDYDEINEDDRYNLNISKELESREKDDR